MLNISKPLSAGQAQSYHKLEYTSAEQSYYRQGNAVQGEWHGKLAERMGLSGEVGAQEFTRLSEGHHPQTGEQLVRHRMATEYTSANGTTVKAVEHRAGWDATFSAPKSVSLTALVGGDDRVREAHRAAVNIALDELERYTQARIGGNHPAETTGKFVAAKFEHDTARPVAGYAAPQLHTHVVIFNVTERADSSTRAMQPLALFDSQQYATAIYQSELMYRLRELGYQIEPGKSGAPEIKGYTREYLDVSSLRREQIENAMAKAGVSGHEAAEIAAHSTRSGKQSLSPAEVLAAHRKMAEEYGNQPQRVIAEAQDRTQGKQFMPDRAARAREAVSYARGSIYEREAVADERLIFRDTLRRGMGEITYKDARSEFESRHGKGDFRTVEIAKYASGRSFTTPETITAERANVAFMQAGQNAIDPIMSAEKAQAVAASREFLSDAQRRVIEEVLNSQDRIHGLQGRAGTGKTTVLGLIRESAEGHGYTVEGFAPTSRAAAQLREAGIDAHTLQHFLARGENPSSTNPAPHHLYVLDESSLASTRQMRVFLERLSPDDRVLLVGDTRQHQGVDAGKPFEQMQDAGMRTSHLDRILRQKDPELLKAVEHLSRNETRLGLEILREQGRVTEVPNYGERIAAIAREYAVHPENTIVVSPDNKSRQEINQAVRSVLQENGKIQKDDRQFQTLVHRSDMTGADRTWAARYAVGDTLKYTTGSKEQGIERGSFATVRSVDARVNTLTVELPNGTTTTYDPRRLRGVNVYSDVERAFSVGDRLQFTAPSKELRVANRDLGTILEIGDREMRVKMDGKTERLVTFDPASFRHFDHGYAVTSHSAQGLTTARVIAHFDTEGARSLINTRLAYVAISRASDDARIFTNEAATLGERLAADVSKSAALDFRPPSKTEQVQEAVEAFRASDAQAATKLLYQQGRVHVYSSPEHRLATVALDYVAQIDRAVVLAPNAEERQELTQLIRDELRQNGRLTGDDQRVSILVEQRFGNPGLAANYLPGDRIHYRTGNPADLGIADDSTARVLSIDAHANTLTVGTLDVGEVSYNPALTRKMTGQSAVYRGEQRNLAVGERIRFTAVDQEQHIRSGDFAVIERISEDHALSVRLDNGKSAELDSGQATHIEYGYAVETPPQGSVDRILISGEASELAKHGQDLARLSPSTRDIAVYTSDSRDLNLGKELAGVEPGLSPNGAASGIENIAEASIASIALEAPGIGLS